MKINRNDPRLTAYVLNELSAEEMKQIEAAISADPDLAKEVASLKHATGVLFSELNSQAQRLDQERREKIFAKIPKDSSWFEKYWKISAGLVTASIAFVIFTSNRSAMMSKVVGSRSDHLVADSVEPSASNFYAAKQSEIAPPTPPRAAAPPQNVAVATKETKDSAAEMREPTMPAERQMVPESAGSAVADAEPEMAMPSPKKSSAAMNDEAAKVVADSVPSGLAAAGGSGGAPAPTQAAAMKADDGKARSAIAPKTKMFTSARAKSAEDSSVARRAPENFNISFVGNNNVSKELQAKFFDFFAPKLSHCISEHTLRYGKYNVSLTAEWVVANARVRDFKIARLSVPKEDISDLLSCFQDQIESFAGRMSAASQTESKLSFDISFEK